MSDEYKETSLDDLIARKETMDKEELDNYLDYAWDRFYELQEQNRLEDLDSDILAIIQEVSYEQGKRGE